LKYLRSREKDGSHAQIRSEVELFSGGSRFVLARFRNVCVTFVEPTG